MRKLKKSISILLSVCIFASVACVASASVSAYADLNTAIKNAGLEESSLNTYYFYMPDSWKNEHTYTAGVFWWEGTLSKFEWPGYVITEKSLYDSNIYVAKIPNDVTFIIWNNAVDNYSYSYQTKNVSTEWYGPGDDEYGFYPNGIKSFNGMIYVCDPVSAAVSPLAGDWFYYYGDGTYSYYPTKVEAIAHNAVYSGGEFPKLVSDNTTEVTLNSNSTTLYVGESYTLTATVKNANGKTTYTSNNTNVATVDSNGKITAKSSGTTTVTVTNNGVSATFTVYVLQPNPTEPTPTEAKTIVNFLSYATVLTEGNTYQTSVSVYNPKGATTYTSSNTYVATISNSGLLTAVSPGTTQITVTNNGASAKFTLQVVAEYKPPVTVTKKTQNITAKSSYTKTCDNKAFSLNAKTNGNGKLSYTSSDKKVVTVSSNGKVTIKGSGKATITVKAAATSKYKSASKKITIKVKPGKIKITSAKPYSKKLKLKIKQQKNCSGYESQLSEYKNFKNSLKTTYPSNIKGLGIGVSGKKLYYFRIRAYKKIDGEKVYGKWTKVSFSV